MYGNKKNNHTYCKVIFAVANKASMCNAVKPPLRTDTARHSM